MVSSSQGALRWPSPYGEWTCSSCIYIYIFRNNAIYCSDICRYVISIRPESVFHLELYSEAFMFFVNLDTMLNCAGPSALCSHLCLGTIVCFEEAQSVSRNHSCFSERKGKFHPSHKMKTSISYAECSDGIKSTTKKTQHVPAFHAFPTLGKTITSFSSLHTFLFTWLCPWPFLLLCAVPHLLFPSFFFKKKNLDLSFSRLPNTD